MSKAEVRKGRWGVIGAGFFAKLSGSGTFEGPLYKSGDLVLQQGFVSLPLAYRVIDDRRGYLDFYAGARYNYLGIDIDLATDPSGISEFSSAISGRVTSGVDRILDAILANPGAAAGLNVAALVEQQLGGDRLEKLADVPDAIRKVARGEKLAKILSVTNPIFADYVVAQANAKATAAAGGDARTLEAQAAAARKKLSKQLAKELEDALPISADADRWWIDPIVGFRGQINLTRWLFLAVQGDAGGFGVGSQITWNAEASLGVNFTRNIYATLGYRYMYVDYDHDNFLYQVNSYGLFSSLGVKF